MHKYKLKTLNIALNNAEGRMTAYMTWEELSIQERSKPMRIVYPISDSVKGPKEQHFQLEEKTNLKYRFVGYFKPSMEVVCYVVFEKEPHGVIVCEILH